MTTPSRAERVFEKLLRALATGQWTPGQRMPPTRQLEREFGSSHAAMLDALHLAAERGLLVIQSRRPMVVLPGAAERAGVLLAEHTTRTGPQRLAILYPETMPQLKRTPFFRDLVVAVDRQARRAGLEAEVVSWPLLEQVTFARELPEMGYGAAFAAAVRVEYLTSLHAMRQQRFPVVLMNAVMPKVPMPAVTTDEYGAARRLATLLVDLGHRNLCMLALAFDGRLKQRQHRTFGWFDCLTELGISEQCTMPVRYLTDESETVAAVGRLLGQPNPPTALVFAYGTLCDRFLDGFASAGLEIPRRLSVATFDYSQHFAQATWCPPLTSFSFNLDRLAECAIEMIGKMLDGQEQTRSIRIPMQLNLTDSVGPAPRRK